MSAASTRSPETHSAGRGGRPRQRRGSRIRVGRVTPVLDQPEAFARRAADRFEVFEQVGIGQFVGEFPPVEPQIARPEEHVRVGGVNQRHGVAVAVDPEGIGRVPGREQPAGDRAAGIPEVRVDPRARPRDAVDVVFAVDRGLAVDGRDRLVDVRVGVRIVEHHLRDRLVGVDQPGE